MCSFATTCKMCPLSARFRFIPLQFTPRVQSDRIGPCSAAWPNPFLAGGRRVDLFRAAAKRFLRPPGRKKPGIVWHTLAEGTESWRRFAEAVNPSDWGPFDKLRRFRCRMAGTRFHQIQSIWRHSLSRLRLLRGLT
jgi:hypothetical protein